jgi:hypothetical protein
MEVLREDRLRERNVEEERDEKDKKRKRDIEEGKEGWAGDDETVRVRSQ